MTRAPREEYFNLPLENDEKSGVSVKTFTLVIYDISDNKRRLKLAKILLGFGCRVQESAFEAMLTKQQLKNLLDKVHRFACDEDNIRIYRIRGNAVVAFYGEGNLVSNDDVIFV